MICLEGEDLIGLEVFLRMVAQLGLCKTNHQCFLCYFLSTVAESFSKNKVIAIKFARPCDVSRGYLRQDLWESGPGEYNSAVKVIDLNRKVAGSNPSKCSARFRHPTSLQSFW